MRILLLNNYYRQSGGEDQVIISEVNLLEAYGHEVLRYSVHNDQIAGAGSLGLVKDTLWNNKVYRELRTLIRKEQPQVVHVHNYFPILSPSAYYAAKAEGVPVVQSLHNYRLVCPNGLFLRDGKICEDCLDRKVPWPGVLHACYRKSRGTTGTVAAMIAVHRALGTWARMVDVYIALTEFGRKKFIQGGLPAEKIVVKPHFVFPDPGFRPGGQGDYALFVGRLSQEKGVDTLLAAWEKVDRRIPLKIVGDGPLADSVREAAGKLPNIEWLGARPLSEIYDLMREATFLILPSNCYEGLPRTAVESYAVGTPIIASELGALSSIVKPGRTGLFFRHGDPEMLAGQVEWAMAHRDELLRMRKEARAEFESVYTGEQNYKMLMEIYQRVSGDTTQLDSSVSYAAGCA